MGVATAGSKEVETNPKVLAFLNRADTLKIRRRPAAVERKLRLGRGIEIKYWPT